MNPQNIYEELYALSEAMYEGRWNVVKAQGVLKALYAFSRSELNGENFFQAAILLGVAAACKEDEDKAMSLLIYAGQLLDDIPYNGAGGVKPDLAEIGFNLDLNLA